MSDLELRQARRAEDWIKYWALVRRANLWHDYGQKLGPIRFEEARCVCGRCLSHPDCARCSLCASGYPSWRRGPYSRRTIFSDSDYLWCCCCTPLDSVLAYPEQENGEWRKHFFYDD